MTRAVRRSVALLLAGALIAACSGGSDGSGGSDELGADDESAAAAGRGPEEVTDGDFYAAPDPVPDDDHGTLLRYQPVDGLDVGGATGWRIMYASESPEGDPIVVTGTALVPPGEAPSGGRPVLTIAHGTSGIADECAPSKRPAATELSLMGPFVDAGYLVVLSDYEGLGTPGRHPYLVGESEGRGVLDAAVAARDLPDADAGDQLSIFGYSQGGHGALWAGQLAADWAPDYELVGTVAGAPATELPIIFSAAGSLPIAGFLYMIIAGFAAAYPGADPALVLTPAGEGELPQVDEGCVGDVIRHFASTPNAELLKPGLAEVEPWADLEAANDPGRVVTDNPILIVHSAADDVVPAALSQALVQRMCSEGQVVERRVYDKGQGHVEAVPDAVSDAFEWLQQQAAGDAPVSTCPAAGTERASGKGHKWAPNSTEFAP
ncbi:MAG TPA: lipase family protein [Acidimicrobiales bacterium]|nr:lipase family protein [Acidimicrobiales bacterium]